MFQELKLKELQKKINELDKESYHQLFFDYSLKKNWLKKPFLLIFKLFFKIQNKPAIDHVCHISRFAYDDKDKNYYARVFEATLHGGMEENDLLDKLKNLEGKVYIRTLGKVDKVKAKEFEKKYTGLPYDSFRAGLAGLDIDFIDKYLNIEEKKSGFCSWLEALFIQNQGYNIKSIENGNPLEITPTDLFEASFSSYSINLFYKT
jgi:hypothetical protein